MGKKILFTSHTANFQKFNRPFMRMLRKDDWEVHYASMGEEEILDADKSFTVSFTRNPFTISNIRAYKQLKQIIDRENYDIIHTHTPVGSVVTRLAARRARSRGTRVIYTAHGFHFFTGAPLLSWLIYYPVERFMARHTDTLITINDEDYKRAKRTFKTDVRYVPGVGVDPERFKPRLTKKQRNDLRRSLGLKPDDFVMIYPAELNKNKNQTMLIMAMEKLTAANPHIHLLLPGQDSMNGFHSKLIKEKGLQNNIHLLGYRADIPQLLMASDLSVSASYREGLPVHIMEAMTAGLPIISTKCRGATELIEEGENGYLVDFDDVEAMTAEIMKMSQNGMHGFGKCSKNKSKKYQIEHITKEMKKTYCKKQKILHLLSSSQFSGAESVACTLILGVDGQYEIAYCSPTGTIKNVLSAKNIEYCPLEKFNRKALSRVIADWKPDVIHAHDFRASILASFFAKEVEIISHIHQNPAWSNKITIRSLLYRWRIKKFMKIVIVTDAMRNNFIFRGVTGEKLIIIHNLVDKNSIIEKSKVGLGTPSYDIAFCGRLESVKQPLEFLDIIYKIKKTQANVRAIMIGEGSLRKDCELYVNKNCLQDNVVIAGFQNNPYQYIKNSKFLFITSTDEGFGLVAAEADILNTVVLSFNLKAIAELFSGARSTYKTKNTIIQTYLECCHNRKEYQQLLKSQQKSLPTDITDKRAWQNNLLNLYKKASKQ